MLEGVAVTEKRLRSPDLSDSDTLGLFLLLMCWIYFWSKMGVSEPLEARHVLQRLPAQSQSPVNTTPGSSLTRLILLMRQQGQRRVLKLGSEKSPRVTCLVSSQDRDGECCQPERGWGPVESPRRGLSVLRPALSSRNRMLATYVI